jgi:hypothetical protein
VLQYTYAGSNVRESLRRLRLRSDSFKKKNSNLISEHIMSALSCCMVKSNQLSKNKEGEKKKKQSVVEGSPVRNFREMRVILFHNPTKPPNPVSNFRRRRQRTRKRPRRRRREIWLQIFLLNYRVQFELDRAHWESSRWSFPLSPLPYLYTTIIHAVSSYSDALWQSHVERARKSKGRH